MNGVRIIRWKWWPEISFVLLLLATVVQLRRQGRIWWCECARPFIWDGDIWSAHNSQHLFDPYSFTHVLHGVIFCGLISLVFPRIRLAWGIWITAAAESFWEILENTHFIIQRYREATIGQGYAGDSIANSISDIACCTFGFLLARRLGVQKSIILFLVTELVLLILVRDNLTLNVLMLIFPIDAVKSWQMVH